MAETIDLVRDSTMQGIARSVAAIAANTGGFKINSFADVQAIVRSGMADKVFAIGDQITVEKETAINATVGNTDAGTTPGITAATVNADTFIAAVGSVHNGDYEFNYDGAEWHYNGAPVQLAAYGITVTGTAAHGDAIIVHETAATLVFDVIGIDAETPADPEATHSLTLQLHDCYTSLQYDNTEALYYCENELTAGTYNFALLAGYDAEHGGAKTYQFTLTQNVPAGGVLLFPWAYNVQAASTKVSSYATVAAATAIESVSVEEGNGGTALGTADGTEPNMNHTHRIRYGSNNWKTSAMRQYLNSDAAAGSVWTPQTKFDRPPTWAATTAGFLRGLDPEFIAVLGTVKKTTTLNTLTDGGGTEVTNEKIFLLSRSGIYAGNETAGGEDAPYAYYKNFSTLAAAGTGADANRIKYRNGSAQIWWLRTPHVGHACYVRNVSTTGAFNYTSAGNSCGVAPACVII